MICFVTTQPTESCQTQNAACRTSFIKKDLKTTSRPLVQQWHHTTSKRGNVGVAYIQVIIHMRGNISTQSGRPLPTSGYSISLPTSGWKHTLSLEKSRHYLWSTNQRNGCTQTSFLTTTQSSSQWIPRMGYAYRWKVCTFVTGVFLLGDMFPNILTVQFWKTYFVVL